MKYKDYYATLGIARDADLDQIKKAYRKLARQHHPDMSKSAGTEARFKEIGEAYATLKDPDKRAAYDELGRRPAGEEFAPPPQWTHQHPTGAESFEDIDLSDLLASLGRARRPGAGHGPVPMQGRDFETQVRISLEDANRGRQVTLELADAGGGRTLEVTVPPGVTEGQKLRLRGKGGKGRNGGADGDIYLHITIAPHAVFRPDGHDLHFDLLLAPWEAALGVQIEVSTLEGAVLLVVPAGTRSGRKLRMRERGMADGRGGHGDLYAHVLIDVPATLSERERELFKELGSVSRFNPRVVPAKENAP